MFLILILAAFGNMAQLQLKYDYCKDVGFKPEYCLVQKKLHESSKRK